MLYRINIYIDKYLFLFLCVFFLPKCTMPPLCVLVRYGSFTSKWRWGTKWCFFLLFSTFLLLRLFRFTRRCGWRDVVIFRRAGRCEGRIVVVGRSERRNGVLWSARWCGRRGIGGARRCGRWGSIPIFSQQTRPEGTGTRGRACERRYATGEGRREGGEWWRGTGERRRGAFLVGREAGVFQQGLHNLLLLCRVEHHDGGLRASQETGGEDHREVVDAHHRFRGILFLS